MLQHQSPFVLSFSALFLAIFCHYCSATKFIVGDSAGWVIPPYPTYYSNWSQSHLIRAGDSLEFDFDDKFYNLIQVTQYEYEHCTSVEPVRVFNGSPVIFPLKETGVYFFICTISNYCCLGQKIAISVNEGYSQNSPSPSPLSLLSPSLSPSPSSLPSLSPSPSSLSPSQVPSIMSPQLSPNSSTPQPNGSITMPPILTPGGDAGNSPSASSTNRGKFNTGALVCGRSFIVSMGQLLCMLVTFLGLWVM